MFATIRPRLVLAALLLPLLAAVSVGALAAEPRVLRYAFPIAETGFDPAQISDLYSATVVSNIFESPLTYDYLSRPIRLKPQTLQAMPEVSADFKTFTLRVKPGILFSDDAAFKGQKRELVAADYAYSLKRHFDPRWKSPRYAALQGERISGMDELRQRATKSSQPFEYDTPVTGLQVLDRYTLRIQLDRPSPRFEHYLAHSGVAGAVAREVVEAYADTIMAHPVGTGPFYLAKWRRSSQMVLERNPNFRELYYDEQPAAGDAEAQAIALKLKGKRLPLLDRVEISIISESQPLWLAFQAGDFDLVAVPYDYANLAAPGGKLAPNLAKRGMHLHKALRADLVFTIFNMEDPVVGGYSPEKVALRRAISLAYDTDEEIRRLRKQLAVPAQGLAPPETFGYAADFKSEMIEYNPAKAKALLDMYGYVDKDGDGWRDLPDGSPLVLQQYTQPDSSSRQFSEQWKKYMDAVGLRINFNISQWPEQLKQARAGQLMMWNLGNTSTRPDAEESLVMAYGPAKGEDNLVRFALPEYDRLIEKMRALPDGPERAVLIREANRLLVAYMPIKAHVHRIGLSLTQPWLTGLKPHPFMNGFWRFIDVQAPAGRDKPQG